MPVYAMSLVAEYFAFLISSYFLMDVLTLRCAAEPFLMGEATFIPCRGELALEVTQDNSEPYLAASEAVFSSPVATRYHKQESTRRIDTSVTASDVATVTSRSGAPEELGFAQRKPAAEQRPVAALDARSSEGTESKRQLRPPPALSTKGTVDHVPSEAACSIAETALPGEEFRESSLGAYRGNSAIVTAEVRREDLEPPPTTLAPAAGTTVLVRTVIAAPRAPPPLTTGTTAKDTAVDVAPAEFPTGLEIPAKDRTIASDPATSTALLERDVRTTAQTPTLSAATEVSPIEITSGTSLRRNLKGQENALCRHVAVEAQSVCKKLKPTQRTYPCTKQVVDKICEEVPIVIQKMCTKTFYERKPFKCDRVEYKSECIQKKETTKTECVQTVIKGEAYPCPKIDYVTKCNKKPALTPSACKHEVQKEFHYPCERTVKEEQCAEVEREVDQICEEDNVVSEKYDCSKTVYVKKCSPAAGTAPTAIRATGGETLAPKTEGKDEIPAQVGEEKAPRRLRKVTTMPEAVVVPLPKTHFSVEMCVDVPQVKRKTCTRDVVKKERRPCKGVKKEIQCSNVTKVIQEVCSKVKKVVEPYACTKTEMQQECSTVAKQVEDTCTREVPVDEKGPCEIEIFKNECIPVPVRIPDVCFEARPRTEVYDCSENSNKSVCKEELREVEQQCVQTEYREIEYACTQLEHVEKCVVPETTSPTIYPAQPPNKYSKKQHERHLVLPPSEATYEVEEEQEEQEGHQEFEELPNQISPSMYEPLMKKEFVSVLTGPPVKRTKMKWREKLHKLGDPDLGEDEKEGEKGHETKTQAEEGERGKK